MHFRRFGSLALAFVIPALALFGGSLGGCARSGGVQTSQPATNAVQEANADDSQRRLDERIENLRLQRDTLMNQGRVVALDEQNDPDLRRLAELTSTGDNEASAQARERLSRRAVELAVVRSRIADLDREIGQLTQARVNRFVGE